MRRREMTKKLSNTQQIYVEAINKLKRQNKKITMQSIADEVGVNSRATVHAMLKRLKEKGFDYKNERIRDI